MSVFSELPTADWETIVQEVKDAQEKDKFFLLITEVETSLEKIARECPSTQMIEPRFSGAVFNSNEWLKDIKNKMSSL
jgi:hypothetical protein